MPAPSSSPLTATQALLDDANAKYHALITGTAVVKVRDQNGEEITYNLASAARLFEYIQSLTDVLTPSRRISAPMRFSF